MQTRGTLEDLCMGSIYLDEIGDTKSIEELQTDLELMMLKNPELTSEAEHLLSSIALLAY